MNGDDIPSKKRMVRSAIAAVHDAFLRGLGLPLNAFVLICWEFWKLYLAAARHGMSLVSHQ
jgi:hypothetical protein